MEFKPSYYNYDDLGKDKTVFYNSLTGALIILVVLLQRKSIMNRLALLM